MSYNINEKDYTQKEYQYKASNETLYDVEYVLRFNIGSGYQAIAKYKYYPSEEPTDRKLGQSVGESNGYLRYSGYDYPRCECEIELRNRIAEEIEKIVGGTVKWSGVTDLSAGDLGADDLFNDEYFVKCYNSWENYDEDYDEGIEECGILSSNYLSNEMKPAVIGVDKFGRLVVATNFNRVDDKIDSIKCYFVEPVGEQRVYEAVMDYVDEEESGDKDNLKELANNYGYDIVNADKDELWDIRDNIIEEVMANISQWADTIYGYAGIETNYEVDNKIEKALDDLAKTDPNGYEMIRKYYEKSNGSNINIDNEIWCWNILDVKKGLNFYRDAKFKIVVNKKLMSTVKAFSKMTDEDRRIENEAISDFERAGLNYYNRPDMYR